MALDLPVLRPIWESASKQRSAANWGLQWLWNQPEVAVALSGMSTLQQVQENVASADDSAPNSLSVDEIAIIERARKAIKSSSPIPCTQCKYCLPCPNGVNIPVNFDLYNQAAMYDDLGRSQFMYGGFVG